MNYAIIEEPGLMLFGKDTLTSMLEELGIMDQILAEIPDVNFIFISSDRVLVLLEGEDPLETSYEVSPSYSLRVQNLDGEWTTMGTFNEELTEISIKEPSTGITVKLVMQATV